MSFDEKCETVDCDNYNCDLWKFNGQAFGICGTRHCPAMKEAGKSGKD